VCASNSDGGNKSPKLLPADLKQRNESVEWLFAALNSVEVASVP
jgi:glutathione S-transferase